MPRYEVYATRYDSAGIVEELVPARGLEFSLPLSDHGECTFTATVEPGRSLWRAALALPFSGVLVARDGVPVWSGIVIDEQQTGPRTFEFTAREWGWVFEAKVAATARTWVRTNDHKIIRDLITQAQSVSGQNFLIEVGDTLGAQVSDRTINAWDKTTVGREWRSAGDAEGGPEWYINTAGTLEAPQRVLLEGDRLGHVDPQTTMEYVADTLPVDPLRPVPTVALLGDLYPGPAPIKVPVRRAGGNVIALSRNRSLANAATVVIATGSGVEKAQLRSVAVADTLLARGWPRLTAFSDYSDVTVQATLDRHAAADLKDMAGIATGYSLVTLEDDIAADWTKTPRGSSLKVVLDTDVYGGDRPVGGANGFVARCIDMVVRVPNPGLAQVEWRVEDRLEVA